MIGEGLKGIRTALSVSLSTGEATAAGQIYFNKMFVVQCLKMEAVVADFSVARTALVT